MDRLIYVAPPDREGRKVILTRLLSECPVNFDIIFSNLDHITSRTNFFTGADLKNLISEAKLNAIRRIRLQGTSIIQVI